MNWFTTSDLLKRSGPFTFSADYIVWYVIALIALGGGFYFLLRKKSEKTTKIVLTVLWAIAVAVDFAKLIVNICTGFSIRWDLPFYVCSLFMFAMPFAIWGKGVFKRMGCAYICTINLFGAIANYAVVTVVDKYSLFSFYGFHTTLYHTILWAVPLIMLCTGYHRLKFKDFGWAFLGFVVLTLPVVIFNFIAKTDYMYFREGSLPVIGGFAAKVSYAWPLFMYALYAVVMILMQLIVMGITALVELIASKIKQQPAETQSAPEKIENVPAETKKSKKTETNKKNE